MDAPRRCAHCGEPAPAGSPEVTIGGTPVPVCCPGCAAAARWIEDAGLDDYYRLRSTDAPRPEASAPDYAAWEHPAVLASHLVPVEGGVQITVLTDALRCAACAWLVDRSLRRVPGVLEASANAVTGRITMAWDPARAALPALLEHLHRLGFTPHLAQGAALEAARRATRRRDLLRLGIAGLGAMQAMMLAEAVYLDDGQMATATRDFFRWITFFVATPVVFFSGWPFLRGLARDLRARQPGMEALVGGSILLAYAASFVETVRGGPQVWYDAAVMFVLLLLAARQVEQWARLRAREQIDLLARAQPVFATRESPAGQEQVAVGELREGDVLRVAAGQTVPADGVLLAPGDFDESLLTGESRPVPRAAGETVLAGSTCGLVSVRVRVTGVGQRTHLSLLQRLVARAQDERPRAARLADRVASVFVTTLFALAVLVGLAWWQIDPARAFPIALAVLVVSCPCALSLAIPAALATAYAQLARRGVLTVHADALETLAAVDTVMLDKTGTLTLGRPRLVATDALDGGPGADEALALAAALQRGSAHPFAAAFRAAANVGRVRAMALGSASDVTASAMFSATPGATSVVTSGAMPGATSDATSGSTPSAGFDAASAATLHVDALHAVPGRGLEGMVDGRALRLGDAAFAAARADDGAVWLGDGRRALARFELADEVRPDAAEAVSALRSLGLSVELSSGDAQAAVERVADAVGIDRRRHRQSPQAKLERVRELQREGHRVAMIGDGLNDAPVLAGADVSFAFGAGAATAHRSADFVLMGESLRRVPETVALARRTRRIVRQNLAWAVAYNVVALPFAALGWIEPWLAALGMAASSLVVTLNALRLRREVEPR